MTGLLKSRNLYMLMASKKTLTITLFLPLSLEGSRYRQAHTESLQQPITLSKVGRKDWSFPVFMGSLNPATHLTRRVNSAFSEQKTAGFYKGTKGMQKS